MLKQQIGGFMHGHKNSHLFDNVVLALFLVYLVAFPIVSYMCVDVKKSPTTNIDVGIKEGCDTTVQVTLWAGAIISVLYMLLVVRTIHRMDLVMDKVFPRQ